MSKSRNGVLEMVIERDPRRIYDRMVAWFVRHDFPVPLSTEEFLDGLRSRCPERDAMVFLPEQVGEYDRKRAQAARAPQMEMFVFDERSAIDWLTDCLRKRPSTYQDIHPEFHHTAWRRLEEARGEARALCAAGRQLPAVRRQGWRSEPDPQLPVVQLQRPARAGKGRRSAQDEG